MARPSDLRLAQFCIGVLLLVILRSLSEVFRLYYLHGDALGIGQVTAFVAGALFAAVALAATILCYFASLYRVAMTITATSLLLLFVYKVVVLG